MARDETTTSGNRPPQQGGQPPKSNDPKKNEKEDQTTSKDRDMYAEGTPDSSRQFGEMSGKARSNLGSSGLMPGTPTSSSGTGQGTRQGQNPGQGSNPTRPGGRDTGSDDVYAPGAPPRTNRPNPTPPGGNRPQNDRGVVPESDIDNAPEEDIVDIDETPDPLEVDPTRPRRREVE